MAGTLEINEHVAWMPAGWVFDGVLELIASEIGTDNAELAAILNQARAVGIQYGDLRGIGSDQFGALLRSAERAYAKALARGPSGFNNPIFYGGFMTHFESLMEVLRSDPRATKC